MDGALSREQIHGMASRWMARPPEAGALRIVTDTSDFFRLETGDVLLLGGKPYLMRSSVREARFGLDDEVKHWVKRAIDLVTGQTKIVKLVFYEQFTATIGGIVFECFRSPRKAAVAVTKGALQLLNEEELRGVMGHELAHIKNRDTLTSTIAATIAGAINFLTYMFMFGGGNREVHPLVQIGMLILAPIAAMLIQMAISRSREYVADADGAAIAGSPNGLISALQKLENYGRRIPMRSAPTQNHMFIIQPLTGGGFSKLFSTHPATADRIAKLRMA